MIKLIWTITATSRVPLNVNILFRLFPSVLSLVDVLSFSIPSWKDYIGQVSDAIVANHAYS